MTSRRALVAIILFYDVRFGKPWIIRSPIAFPHALTGTFWRRHLRKVDRDVPARPCGYHPFPYASFWKVMIVNSPKPFIMITPNEKKGRMHLTAPFHNPSGIKRP